MAPWGKTGMRCEHATDRSGRQHHTLRLETHEVGLLTELLEVALNSERLTGRSQADPHLVTFFNTLYADLLETARQAWEEPSVPIAASPSLLRRLANRLSP